MEYLNTVSAFYTFDLFTFNLFSFFLTWPKIHYDIMFSKSLCWSLQSRSREQGVKKWISFLITVFPSTIPSSSPQFVYKAKCRFCRGEGYGTTLPVISHFPSLCPRLLAVSYYSCSGIWLFSPPSYMLEHPFPLKLHISIRLALFNNC